MFDTTGLLQPQIEHAKKLLNSLYFNNLAVDLSETGCGKTHVASALARAVHRKIVVICPKLVIPVWKRVLESYGQSAEIIVNYEKICRGNTPWLKYRKAKFKDEDRHERTNVKFPKDCLIILDESHKCKGVNSLQSGFLKALKRQGYQVLLLSATQACSPLDMRAFGYVTNLHDGEMKDFKSFCEDYGAEWVGKWGAQYFNGEDVKVKEKFRKCHVNLFETQQIASRLTRDEMGDLFPENEIIAEAYDMGAGSDAIQRAYDEMEEELARLDEKTENYSGHIFAVIVKWRRRIEMQKVPVICEMTEDLYDENKSVVIFVNYTDTIETLKSRLESNAKFKGKVGYIYGEASEKQRLKDIDEFESDQKRIIVCNLACGGSINLHDIHGKHPRASIVNPNFSAILMLQALGRIHRTYGKSKCYQRLLFAANTKEEHICRKVQGKLDNLSMLNDGDLVAGMSFYRFCLGKAA